MRTHTSRKLDVGLAAIGFTVPTGTLVVFAIVAGAFAAIFPARRASRLTVLEALQYE